MARIHLVRHGEVDNPNGILYGRLPGFHLSPRGREMAAAAAGWFDEQGIRPTRIVSSPLERTRESAQPILDLFSHKLVIDENLIEPTNYFEGRRMRGEFSALKNFRSWPHLINPLRPSWGEPYRDIAHRMLESMRDLASDYDGDIVCVSHQLPIWIAQRSITHKSLAHDPRKRRCTLSSITTFDWDGSRFRETGYAEPAKSLLAGAKDIGAV